VSIRRLTVPYVSLLAFAICQSSFSTNLKGQDGTNLSELSIEDLINVEVTTAAKKKQKLVETAAAVHVITREDIRRSGATSIPEALRMVPGLHVARIDGNKWSIGTRGFTGRFANSLLVMIDGRSVYTHLYSGVLWSMQDLPLDDIDRIEVIRGSGASLWGVNAVNGIINIITKPARNTQGSLFTVSGGFESPTVSTLRFGGKATDGLYYRGFIKERERYQALNVAGVGADDGLDDVRGGFRMDWERSPGESFTLDGTWLRNRNDDRVSLAVPEPPYTRVMDGQWRNQESSIRARLEKPLHDGSEIAIQTYVTKGTMANTSIGRDELLTADFDIQHHLTPHGPHDIQWGGGYRLVNDTLEDRSLSFNLDPAERTTHQYTSFIQDEIAIAENLSLTAGSKFGYNSYSGFEIQPNVRALWSAAPSHAVWGAVSRAVRTPSRYEADVEWLVALMPAAAVLPPESPYADMLLGYSIQGNKNFTSEVLKAVEGGYRFKVSEMLRLDAAVFHNWYSGLRSLEPENFRPTVIQDVPVLTVPLRIHNQLHGRSYGLELLADTRMLPTWRLSANFNEVHTASIETGYGLASPALPSNGTAPAAGGKAPEHQLSVSSTHDLGSHVEFNTSWRWISGLPEYSVPRYYSAEAKLTLRWTRVEFSVVGTDLLSPRHLEYGPTQFDGMPLAVYVKRGAYTKLAVKF